MPQKGLFAEPNLLQCKRNPSDFLDTPRINVMILLCLLDVFCNHCSGGLNMLLGCFIMMCTFFTIWVVMIGAKLKEKYFFAKGWRLKPNVKISQMIRQFTDSAVGS